MKTQRPIPIDPRLQLVPASARTRLCLWLLACALPIVLSLVLPRFSDRSGSVAYWVRESLGAQRWLEHWIGAGIVALLTGGICLMLDCFLRRHRLRIDPAGIEIDTTLYRRRLSWPQLDLAAARVIDIDEHPEAKPMLKTNGYRPARLPQRLVPRAGFLAAVRRRGGRLAAAAHPDPPRLRVAAATDAIRRPCSRGCATCPKPAVARCRRRGPRIGNLAHMAAAVPGILLNTPAIEIWPGGLLRARSNHDARLLARATQVLRRKRDGRYLAAIRPKASSRCCLACAANLDWTRRRSRWSARVARNAPGSSGPICRSRGCANAWIRSGWTTATVRASGCRWCRNRRGLPSPDSTAIDGRCGCCRRPRAHGHTCAMRHCATVSCSRRFPATAATITSSAFSNASARADRRRGNPHRQRRAGLQRAPLRPRARHRRARRTAGRGIVRTHVGVRLAATRTPRAYGFVMSYPRDNPHGIVYEPWHWCWRGDASRRA